MIKISLLASFAGVLVLQAENAIKKNGKSIIAEPAAKVDNTIPSDVRALKERHGLTASRIALLTCVGIRNAQSWLADTDKPTYRQIPIATWRLLLILTGEIMPQELIAQIDTNKKR